MYNFYLSDIAQFLIMNTIIPMLGESWTNEKIIVSIVRQLQPLLVSGM